MDNQIFEVDLKDYDLVVEAQEIDEELESSFTSVANSYIQIGSYLLTIQEKGLYKHLGYDSLYDYSFNRFKLSETATKNFMSLFKKFGETNTWGNAYLKSEYEDYSYSQLVELVSVPVEKLNDYKPSLTISEIRVAKKLEKYKDILVQELKKIYLEFLDNSSFLENVSLTKQINLEKDLYVSENICYIVIPCKYDLEFEENSSIRLTVKIDGGLKKHLRFNAYRSFPYSDVETFSIDDFNLFNISIKEAIIKIEETIINTRKQLNESKDKKETQISRENYAKKLENLKQINITRIKDLDLLEEKPKDVIISFFELLSKCNNGTVVSSNPFSKNVIASINQPKYYPILKFDKEFYITYGKLEIRFATYWVGITIYYGKEKKVFGVDALIDLLNKSNGSFYPIDLETVFMAEFINPMSDFENIEVEEIE